MSKATFAIVAVLAGIRGYQAKVLQSRHLLGKYESIMPKPTVYLETSVVSYLLSKPSENPVSRHMQEATRDWWENHVNRFSIFASEAVLNECSQGDTAASKIRVEFLRSLPLLAITDEAQELAAWYIKQGIVPAKVAEDALHFSLAALNQVDFICTWNQKHIANAFVQRRLRLLNESRGIHTPLVATPESLREEGTA